MSTYPLIYYCDDAAALNVVPNASELNISYVPAPWLCVYTVVGCLDPTADNFQSFATSHQASLCMFGGCNDTEASNWWGGATFNNGSCVYFKPGCMVRQPRAPE